MINNKITNKLILAARAAQKNAYAPYSKYKVGAALLPVTGRIISGFNIENASFPLGLCAERTALANAYANGVRKFKTLVIATKDGGSPCGACRQVIWELCGDIDVVLVDKNGKTTNMTSRELLPAPFQLR